MTDESPDGAAGAGPGSEGTDTAHVHEHNQIAESISKIAESIEVIFEALTETRAVQEELGRALAWERNRRIVGLARRDSSNEMPEKIALIVAVPRSGSTWSYDMVRTLPSVFIEPSAIIWEHLGLRGRRYPTALSDSPSATIAVEVAPGIGAEIEALIPGVASRNEIAVEKLHPEFFGFSAGAFDHAIRRIESGAAPPTVVTAYQIRHPVEAMWSMARYKQRDPSWYDHVPMGNIPAFMKQTFETIEQLVAVRPGFIVDFVDLHDDAPLARLFEFIDPSINTAQAGDHVAQARRATERETRVTKQARPFLGRQEGSSATDLTGPEGAWTSARGDIDACIASYERLASQRDTE